MSKKIFIIFRNFLLPLSRFIRLSSQTFSHHYSHHHFSSIQKSCQM